MSEPLIITPEQVPQLLAELSARWRPSNIRHAEDTIAPDGNHYTFAGDCEGCMRLRHRTRHLEDAVSELQDLLSGAIGILSAVGLIKGEDTGG